MPFGLLKYGLSKDYPARRHFTPRKALKPHYDVVIIGGGGHAAATAYYLSKYHGVTDVAILEKSDRVWTLPVKFSWSDVGTWESLANELGVGEPQGKSSKSRTKNRVIAGKLPGSNQ